MHIGVHENGKARRGIKVTTEPHLVSMLRMDGAIHLPFLYAFMARTGKTFIYLNLKICASVLYYVCSEIFCLSGNYSQTYPQDGLTNAVSLHIKLPLLSVRRKFFRQTQLIQAQFCTLYIRYGSGSSWYLQASIRSRISRHRNALDTVKQFSFLFYYNQQVHN